MAHYKLNSVASRGWGSRDAMVKMQVRREAISGAKRIANDAGAVCEIRRVDGVVLDYIAPDNVLK